MSLHAGVAVRSVPVPVGTPMGGFAARLSGSTGVHDATTVRALVIDGTALVSVDVCVLHEDTCAAIRRAAGSNSVVVLATHTHGGPSVGCGRAGTHSAAVHDAIVLAAVEAISAAHESQRPTRLAWASVRGLGVAKDRRHPERSIDPPIIGLRFESHNGDVLATLVNYPCHPVVLDAGNTLITADYVAPLRETVEASTGAPCLFVTGAAGDVNTGHSATDSFRPGAGAERSFERAEEIGRVLGGHLVDAQWLHLRADAAILRQREVALSFEQLTPAHVNDRLVEWQASLPESEPGRAELVRRWIDWAADWRPMASSLRWLGKVSVIDLGDAQIVTLPGEPFLWASDSLSREGRHVIVAGYADGVPGYLPTWDAYPEGGYEVDDAHMYYAMPAPFRRGSLEYVVETARALMEE